MNTSYVASIACLALSATQQYVTEWIHLDAVHILCGPMEDTVVKPIKCSIECVHGACPTYFHMYYMYTEIVTAENTLI
jgi:hypothetical protein